MEWEEPIKERRVWEKGGDDGVGSVCGDQDRVKGSGEGELAVLRGDGEFGLCGCGEATQGQGLGASEWAHPALRQRIHVWVWDVWCCDGGEVGDVWGDCREAEQTKQIWGGENFLVGPR